MPHPYEKLSYKAPNNYLKQHIYVLRHLSHHYITGLLAQTLKTFNNQ